MSAKSKFRLRIYQDHFTERAESKLNPARRIIYCVAGNATIEGGGKQAKPKKDDSWFSSEAIAIRGEVEGGRLWRWELVPADAPIDVLRGESIKSVIAGDYELDVDTSVKQLMRLDRVSFPLGGEALTHIHAAPGVRCLLEGNLLLRSMGHEYRVWPADPWLELGPDSVYAKASEHELTSFVRVMIIPAEYRDRSTITYVKAEDKDKPKSQSYKRYLEESITF